jgi:glycosyltransferase involved in cell wall biosynthesis
MKKILIVNSHIPWGGLGQFTLSLARGLKEKEYKVFGLVTHSNEDNFKAFTSITDSTVYFGNYSKLLKYLAIWWYIFSTRPDVIIINYNAVIHFLLPFLPKSIVIDIIHNDVDDFYRISGINQKYVSAWVAPTPGIKDGFIHYCNFPRAKTDTLVISHGIAESKYSRKPTSSDELILAFVGAVYEHKGADLLPEIFEKVLAVIPYAQLKIIGTGKMEADLKNTFEQKGIMSHVEFMGVIAHDAVRETLAFTDVLLFPTRVEAFGLVIAEAMMEGAVPVVTLLPGITDATVTNDVTGYLIPKNDIDTFVEKCIALATEYNLLQQMSQKAQFHAKEHLSLHVMIQNYHNLIHRKSTKS